MKAVWNGQTIAEADRAELIHIEGNWYFPPDCVDQSFLRTSDTPYTCWWKGDCQYFDVGQGNEWSKDSAWAYQTPMPSAIQRVKKDFSHYIAFWRGVQVTE